MTQPRPSRRTAAAAAEVAAAGAALAGAALLLALCGGGCGPPTPQKLIEKVEAEATPENLAAADPVLDSKDINADERDRLFKVLAAHAADGAAFARVLNRYLDHSEPDRLGPAYDTLLTRWDELFAKSVPTELDVNRFLPLLGDPEHGAKTAQWIAKHTPFPTITTTKMFEMVFDNGTRKEALAGLLAIPDIKDWATTDMAKKTIDAVVARAGPDAVKAALTGMAATDPVPPTVAGIGVGLADHLIAKKLIKDYAPEVVAMIVKLLLAAGPDSGAIAADTLARLLGTVPPDSRKLAVRLTAEAVRTKSPIAILAVTLVLKEADKDSISIGDDLVKTSKDAAAPAIADAVVHAPAMPPRRTADFVAKLKAWKVPDVTGPAELHITNADGEPYADVEAKLCRGVVPPPPPPGFADDDGDDDGDAAPAKKGKKPKKAAPPRPEPKMDACGDSAKSAKDGLVKFPAVDIGVWYVVTKSPGRKWTTEVNATPDGKEYDPAWRCELRPTVGCNLMVVAE
ncbi:MAG TPA: hypothetical protein VG389_10985 [Myxococcota bacterium]|jgi:hypothetical protein|nr:hypothetical protein [Myxococcota bacterium]